MDVKEESILGPEIKDHWYYVSKGRALRMMLGSQPVNEVLDVGAGSGVFTRQLLDHGLAKRGVCVDPGYTAEHVESYNGGEIYFVRGVKDVSQDLILMMDVLEHVDDDVGLLRKYTDRLPPGGRVAITVPAFQFLWSSHDVFLDHRRRYTLSQLKKVVTQADLRVVKARYFFGALFPVVAAIRLRDQLRLKSGKTEAKSQLKWVPKFIGKSLIGIHDLERYTLFSFNRWAGLTAFCLATRD
ncbi:MAG: class I SAM-dependent methyltransferase [Minwuiales bacterium]|nr:class I SAM-dependent methyltransferase [Minwuiales bacterium]